MIKLQRVESGNPFEQHPCLRSVFPVDLAAYVEADTVADIAAAVDPHHNHVFLVLDSGHQVVGLTGFFVPEADDGRTYLGLRWHGIVPEHRSRGYSLAAFKEVVELAR